MTAINTNVGALNARLYTLGATRDQEKSYGASFLRPTINSAADDAMASPLQVKWSRSYAASIWRYETIRMVLD